MEREEMTTKKSQIVLPINPTTLFTSIVGAVIIGFLGYISTKADEWSDATKEISYIKTAITEQVARDKAQSDKLLDYGQRIQRIEETRFKSEDAMVLKNEIVDEVVREIKLAVQPVGETARRNERDIEKIEKDVEALKHR